MRKNKTTLLCALILLLAGALFWRESGVGLLRIPEQRTALWVAISSPGSSARVLLPPTLVFQGGIEAGQLSALDIGLFARAARKLSAAVVATTAYEFPRSEVSLEMRTGDADAPAFLAGTLLMKREARAGISPVHLPALDPRDWKTETFGGSFSGFFPGSGWQGGFLNLPSQPGQAGRFPVLARLGDSMVASFPLAALLALLPNADPAQIQGTPATGLRIGDWLLPLAEDGSLPLDLSLLGSLRRADMDDVLINVERLDRGAAPDPELAGLFAGQAVLLGTLGSEATGAGIRLDTGRQFSLVEFQGLALASLQGALLPPAPPWWGSLLALLASVGLGIVIFRTHSGRRFWVTLSFLSGWLLFALSFFASGGWVPPLIGPGLVLLLALLLAPWLASWEGRPGPE